MEPAVRASIQGGQHAHCSKETAQAQKTLKCFASVFSAFRLRISLEIEDLTLLRHPCPEFVLSVLCGYF